MQAEYTTTVIEIRDDVRIPFLSRFMRPQIIHVRHRTDMSDLREPTLTYVRQALGQTRPAN